jgi:hypothetical protein
MQGHDWEGGVDTHRESIAVGAAEGWSFFDRSCVCRCLGVSRLVCFVTAFVPAHTCLGAAVALPLTVAPPGQLRATCVRARTWNVVGFFSTRVSLICHFEWRGRWREAIVAFVCWCMQHTISGGFQACTQLILRCVTRGVDIA